MTYLVENDFGAFGRIIADGLADVFEEMHAIDLADLVGHIHQCEYAAIEDLLQAASELFFREGTLSFGWNARVDLPWDGVPTVTLGMEFTHQTVSVFFNTSLRPRAPVVEVVGILFDPECRDAAERRSRLGQALSDAVLPGRPTIRP